jgi:hypothetical protein
MAAGSAFSHPSGVRIRFGPIEAILPADTMLCGKA